MSEVFDLTKSGYQTDDPEKKRELFNIMCSEIEDHALMCCAIQVQLIFTILKNLTEELTSHVPTDKFPRRDGGAD